MINWVSVAANSLWIAGLAVILAGLSYHHWLADQTSRPLRQQLGSVSFQRVGLAGLLLIGVGLAASSNGWWQLVPALALIIVCLIGLFTLRRRRRTRRPGD